MSKLTYFGLIMMIVGTTSFSNHPSWGYIIFGIGSILVLLGIWNIRKLKKAKID